MQSMLSYNIHGHFNVQLSLNGTINIITWQSGWSLDFRYPTSTPILNVHVDIDFDVNEYQLRIEIYRYFSIDKFMVSRNIYGRHGFFVNVATYNDNDNDNDNEEVFIVK